MDKKLKLNAKMNIAMVKTKFWLGVSTVAGKLARAVLRIAMKSQLKQFDIIREMLKADYSEDYKNDLREVLKMKDDCYKEIDDLA